MIFLNEIFLALKLQISSFLNNLSPREHFFFYSCCFAINAAFSVCVFIIGTNVLSLYLLEALENEKEFVNKVCENLPNQIKVFGIKRVTGGFNSKLSCDYRSYTYIAPSFAFTPVDKEVTDSFRITSEIVNEVNEVLALFKGTHRFHNFTARR